MSKKSDKGCGVSLFQPELREVARRLKRKEPELEEIVSREGAEKDHETEDAGRDSEDPS